MIWLVERLAVLLRFSSGSNHATIPLVTLLGLWDQSSPVVPPPCMPMMAWAPSSTVLSRSRCRPGRWPPAEPPAARPGRARRRSRRCRGPSQSKTRRGGGTARPAGGRVRRPVVPEAGHAHPVGHAGARAGPRSAGRGVGEEDRPVVRQRDLVVVDAVPLEVEADGDHGGAVVRQPGLGGVLQRDRTDGRPVGFIGVGEDIALGVRAPRRGVEPDGSGEEQGEGNQRTGDAA